MLKTLSIRNFAIIEKLDLDFNSGLSVLTGETGAGKSIIVGALNLVLGGRGSTELIRTGKKFAEVSATFDFPKDVESKKLIKTLGIETSTDLLLRRQVQSAGRSKAWINDSPVSISALGNLAEKLVDIAGQHQHQSLMKTENHLLLLDRFAKLDSLRIAVGKLFEKLHTLVKEKNSLKSKSKQQAEREDFLRFKLKEIEQADIKLGEKTKLEQEIKLLRNSAQIKSSLSAVTNSLSGESGAINMCGKAFREFEKLVEHLDEVKNLNKRLESARLEIEDISQTASHLLLRTSNNPSKLESIEDRLSVIYRILKKHGPTTADLLEKEQSIKDELKKLESLDESLNLLDKQIEEAGATTLKKAKTLSKKRTIAAKKLSGFIEQHLFDLGMNKTCFNVSVTKSVEINDDTVSRKGSAIKKTGIDDVEFMISPNVGEDLKALTRIASGGELSRVMLAIKSVLLADDPVEVSVFDEVDAGIGGEIAQKVGEKIRELSGKRQVICITHLPQIVAYALYHYKVSKSTRQKRTYTKVDELTTLKGREEELARMLTGQAASKASKSAAKELLQKARQERLKLVK